MFEHLLGPSYVHGVVIRGRFNRSVWDGLVLVINLHLVFGIGEYQVGFPAKES